MDRESSTGSRAPSPVEDRRAWSIRKSLQGELLDFIRGSGFSCTRTEQLVCDLAALVCSYREEDIPLYPHIYVLDDIDALALLAPGTARVQIGTMAIDDGSAARLLKECANLARGGWAIYVTRPQGQRGAEFGVFRALKHSFAIGANEVMSDTDKAVILIRNRGHHTAELCNTKHSQRTVSLTSADDKATATLTDHVRKLVDAASRTASTSEDQRAEFRAYLTRLFIELLQPCHGALVAVVDQCVASAVPAVPDSLSDAVWLPVPVDLYGAHIAAVDLRDAESLATLQSCESLVAGMLDSDGVLILDAGGYVLGYRLFLKPTDEESQRADHKSGGRGRAFAMMVNRIGSEFDAAFMRSQDGATACEAKP
ncbi:MAG: hypothetical protein JWN04_4443 [Myxococcaceae bacterium]|nr:hypothetical protein [Myxococcaceae bacterium]